VAFGNVDVNNYVRANKYRCQHQYSTDGEDGKMSCGTTARVFANELPDGAAMVKEIKQSQKHSFSGDEIRQMVADYTEDRLTVYQLADKYRCNRTTISSVLKRNGVTVARERMDEATVAKAKQLYADGLTLKQVGQQLGICESTVRKTLIKAGTTMREPHRYVSAKR
jgi:transposase-like protein